MREPTRRTLARAGAAAAPLAAAALFFFRDALERLAGGFPRCVMRAATGWWCPACGNTHSVLALLRGDVLEALRYNVAPPLLTLILLGLYAELCFYAAGRPRRILPRSGWVWFPLLGGTLAWYLARNLIPGLLPE